MVIMFRFAKRLFSARIYDNSTDAIADIRSGSSIAIGGYMSAGVPENLIKAIRDYGNYDFTVVTMGSSLENYGINTLIHNKQVKRLITPYIGGSKHISPQYLNGELELKLVPSGTLAERIRAGGAGIPGFWTTTGVGTIIEQGGFPIKYKKGGRGVLIESEGKDKRIFDNKEHIYEEALRTEFASVKAWKADPLGNLVYRRTARNFNPEIAICAKTTIAEVEEIVPIGSLDPDEIDTPGLFVHRIIKGDSYQKPMVKSVNFNDDGRVNASKEVNESINKIAQRVAKELKPGMYIKLDMGIPSFVEKYLEKDVIVASSSGAIGISTGGGTDPDLVDENGEPITINDGGCVVSTNLMMDLLRGGHFDASVVGGLEVSSSGDLAN